MSKIGIDVSVWNGRLDWAALKKAGVAFAIIRSGYGTSHTDSEFARNMEGAIANGIPVGVYHFSYALDVAGAKREAEYVAKLLEPYKDKITLPVFFDFEYDTVDYAAKQGVTLGRAAFNAHAVAFCDSIKAEGYIPGVYYNLDYYSRFVNAAMLADYVQWYAQYAASASIGGWDLWQYSSYGTFSGVSGKFDVNVLANEDLLTGGKKYTGWAETSGERVYYVDNELVKGFKTIDGKNYYFDQSTGYLWHDRYNWYNGAFWHFDEEGIYTMIADRTFYFDKDGTPVEVKESKHYNTIGDVPGMYRDTMDKLVAKGILKGRGGSGEDLVLDMSEDAVRVLVMLDRGGQFG